MSLAICAIVTWLVFIIFSFIPKKLSEIDMLFLYFVNTIFELSIFTIFSINFKWIVVDHSFEKSIADLILRFLMIPMVYLIMSNILLYSSKYLKWLIVVLMILFFLVFQKVLEKLGVISTPHWNVFYSILMFGSYMIYTRLMTWLILKVDKKEVEKIDRL
ncbi:MAG: hypothetical protein ACO1OT_12350 [Heyndrickxia sp.]